MPGQRLPHLGRVRLPPARGPLQVGKQERHRPLRQPRRRRPGRQRHLRQRTPRIAVIGGQAQRGPQRPGELPAAGVPVARRLGQRPAQHLINAGRNTPAAGRQRRRRDRQVRPDHRHVLIPDERHRPAQQLKRRTAQRVLIGPPVHLPALDLLRRHVRRRAQHQPRPGQRRARPALGQAEIRQVHVIRQARPRIDQHVRGLDIAVHQPRPVRRIQRAGHRRDHRRHPDRGQRPLPAQQPPHVTPRHEPHRDEQHPARLPGLIHRQDVRVIDRRRGPGLAQEPAAELLIGGQPRRQHLQRHHPAQPLIAGAEHHRHPARPDLPLQQVPGHPRTRGQGRRPASTTGHTHAHHAPALAPQPPGSPRQAPARGKDQRNAATTGPFARPTQVSGPVRLSATRLRRTEMSRFPRGTPARHAVPGDIRAACPARPAQPDAALARITENLDRRQTLDCTATRKRRIGSVI